MAKDAESGERTVKYNRLESLHRYYYGEMQLPRTIEVRRADHSQKQVNWFLNLFFNWWSLEISFWHRWIGGFSVAYQHPRWIPGWAKYGVLTGFRIFKPLPSIAEDADIPELCRYELWSDIVTDKELAHV